MTMTISDYDAWRAQQDAIKRGAARHRLYTPFGLMVLTEHLRSAAIRHPVGIMDLSTPSGAQIMPDEDIAALVEQLAFGSGVYDIMVRPLVEYLDGRGERQDHETDVVVQLHASDLPHNRLLIDIGPRHERQVEAGRLAAEAIGGHHAHIDIDDVRTAYLENVRLLAGMKTETSGQEEAQSAFWRLLPRRRMSVTEAITLAGDKGIEVGKATRLVMELVANHLVGCDLGHPFDTHSVIDNSEGTRLPGSGDALLKRLLESAAVQ